MAALLPEIVGDGAHAGPCCEYCRAYIWLMSLPLEQRMEAMGMVAINTADPDIDFQVWVEADHG